MNSEHQKIIAFDIDNTINESFYYEIQRFKEFYKEKTGQEYTGKIDLTVSKSEKRFTDAPSNIYKEFFNIYFPLQVNTCPSTYHIQETIDLLKNHGYLIYILTRRDENYDKSEYKGWMCKRDTIKWLEKNNIHYDKLIMSAFDKGEACSSAGIDILVDDEVINILRATTKGINVIIYDRPYNRCCEKVYMTRSYLMHRIERYKPEEFLYLVENIFNTMKREVD